MYTSLVNDPSRHAMNVPPTASSPRRQQRRPARRLSASSRCSKFVSDLMMKGGSHHQQQHQRQQQQQQSDDERDDELDASLRRSMMLKCRNCGEVHAGFEDDSPRCSRRICGSPLGADDFPLKPRRRCPPGDDCGSLPSAMTVSTLEDSLHSSFESSSSSSSSSSASSSSRRRRRSRSRPAGASVAFSTVEIREYPRILGDNPAVRDGPPLTLDWKYDPLTVAVMDAIEYDTEKPPSRRKEEMLVPREIREEWMDGAGHTLREMLSAMKEVEAVKASRVRAMRGANRKSFMKLLKEKLPF